MMMTIAVRHDAMDRRTGRIEPDGFALRLWLPLFLVWLLVAPFFVLLLPLILLGLALARLNPFRALAALFGLLAGLTGTQVEVDSPGAVINIRVF